MFLVSDRDFKMESSMFKSSFLSAAFLIEKKNKKIKLIIFKLKMKKK